jgi:hypothetical protein
MSAVAIEVTNAISPELFPPNSERAIVAAANCALVATEEATDAVKITDSRYCKSSLLVRCAASRYCQQMFGRRPADGKDRI